MNYRLLIIALALAGASTTSRAEPAASQVIRGASYSEKVAPVKLNVDLRALPKPRPWKPGDPIREVPRRLTRPVKSLPDPEPKLDPLLEMQSRAAVSAPAPSAFTTARLNFAGQGFSGANPPDTVGDVGPSHYIQAINDAGGTSYIVYNKTNGSVIAGPFTLSSLGGAGACASGGGDPIVLYDELANRWLLSEFPSSGDNLCVYISQTADPVSGGWYNYSFTLSEFPDYPKYGVWPDAYYVGANESSPALYALDRTNMLVGGVASFQRLTVPVLSAFSFQMLIPADLDGATPPPAGSPGIFMRHRDDESHDAGSNNPAQDYLELYSFAVDWDTPANSTLTGPVSIPVAEFDSHLCGYVSFACIQQQGSATTLDPLREVIMHRLPFRNFGDHQSLAGCFVTDVNGADRAGVRWFELRRTGLGSWSLYQEGTYSPDSHSRWMASIAMDGSGNMALGYNVASSTLYPGLRYTGRLASDPLGTMPQGETTLISGSAANGSNRYGDYSAMGVDPADGCMFWFTGMYNATANWSTRIGSFSFESCGCTAPAAPGGVSASATATNRITVTWSAAAGATSYRVYHADGTCPAPAYTLLAQVTGTAYTNTGLSGGSIHSYVVRSYVTASSCESTNSACAQAVATGACTQPPLFAGLASVSNLQRATCGLTLSWAPAVPGCGTSVAYNIYRFTNSVFTPSASTRIASCLGGTSFEDATVSNGRTNFYLVRAEDPSLAGTGPCAGGTEDTNLVIRSGVASGAASLVFTDAMESVTSKWIEAAVTTSAGTPWTRVNTDYYSASTSYFCASLDSVKDRALRTATPVALPAGSLAMLEFWHRMDQEPGFDGGVLEYSTNGTTWTDILAANGSLPANSGRFLSGGYEAIISSSYSSPIAGRSAWSGTIGGAGAFSRVAVNLSDFAGKSVYLRWRLACDASEQLTGWWLDDVAVSAGSSCASGGYPAWRTNYTWSVGTGLPTEDANGDGYSNFEAYFYGLNPTSALAASDRLRTPAISWSTNGPTLTFTPSTQDLMSASYRIEQTAQVQTGQWTVVLPTPTPGSTGQVVMPVSTAPTNLFLRVKLAE